VEAQAIYTLWLRDIKWFVRDRVRVLVTFVQPFMWLGLIGFGMSGMFPGGKTNFAGMRIDFLDFMGTGILGMTLLFSGTFAGIAVLWDKQFGFMKEILVSPVSRLSVMIGKVLGGATVAILQGLLILCAAAAMGVTLPEPTRVPLTIGFMIVIAVAFVSVGLAFASRLSDPQAFPLVMNFFIMPLFFLSGALFTLDTAPGWLQALAYFNPMTYGIDGLRFAILGGSLFPVWLDFGALLAFAVVAVLLGGYLFRKMTI